MSDTTHDHQQCLALFAKLSEYLDGELDATICQTIERHLQNCQPCQTCLTTLKRTVALCRSADSHPVPEDFSLRLKEMILNLK